MNPRLFPSDEEIARKLEEIALKKECCEILEEIVAELQSNPTSVQYFDLRLVNRAEHAVKRLNEMGI
jgi:hypothetical protein